MSKLEKSPIIQLISATNQLSEIHIPGLIKQNEQYTTFSEIRIRIAEALGFKINNDTNDDPIIPIITNRHNIQLTNIDITNAMQATYPNFGKDALIKPGTSLVHWKIQ
jgi:hypothetical protein